MLNVFLSASVPYLATGRDSWYFENADLVAIRDAVLGVANIVLQENCLIWGGHPSITKLIRYSYQAMAGIDDDNELKELTEKHVKIYQSKWFSEQFPKENQAFGNLVLTDKCSTLKDSLALMRSEMLTDNEISLGIFVGGMDGVDQQEYPLFREKCPHALAVPFPTTGAAALKIYNSSKEYLSKKLGDDFTDRLWKDYAYMDLTHDLIQIVCS